jgi:hypothetical protein
MNSRILVVCLGVGLSLVSARAETTNRQLSILPNKITLTGIAARQQLLAEEWVGAEAVGPATGPVTYTVVPPEVARVENGIVVPLTNGVGMIVASTDQRTNSIPITIEGMDRPFQWSFRNHVQPVLAKTGCSAGACHGAAAGQNGFRLSLRGYDDDGDFAALTRNALGRRVNPSDPGRSLMLLKPTGALPHKGGKRFEVGSPEYRVLSEWIAAGTPKSSESDARIERITILPSSVRLQAGDTQPLLVTAWFSDGHTEDVTRWTKYTAANASVAQIDEQGRVTVTGQGEGAITAWYLSRIAVATITVPFTDPPRPEAFSSLAGGNFIDELVLEKLRSLNLPPSGDCGDTAFIRRLFIDAMGVLPTAAEVKAFAADNSPNKRDALIEKVLARPEFVDYWTYKWSDLFLVSSKRLSTPAMWAYYQWIRSNVSANTSWDQFSRQVITARGSSLEHGAGNFYVLHDDPLTLTETTSLAFLGMSVNCARCHNHPMEKWTNDQYFGMANLFARVRLKAGTHDGEVTVFADSEGELIQPLTGKPQAPRPLDGNPLPPNFSGDRREALADWLVSRDNPYFAKAIVNRIWANYLGAGLVENVDDLRATNPASNEKLFAAAASYLADHHYDLKELMRAILRSKTYQRTSEALRENASDTRFYSHYYPRRIAAEVLLDAIAQATDSPTVFPNYPAGYRASQLPDANVESYFLKTFGRPERNATCSCERTVEPSITQVLHLANGNTINARLSDPKNRISKLLEQKAVPSVLVEEAYYATVSRPPSSTESAKLVAILAEASDAEKRTALEDVYWALLSSKEFLFNH